MSINPKSKIENLKYGFGNSKCLHRYIQLLAAITFLLIIAGGLVTSTQSGLSVPDWPLSYGKVMPPMAGGIRFEHSHRMIASLVGLMTLILAVWMIFAEKRKWVRWISIAAFGLVVTQGILGGMTVLFLLPAPISIVHACLAQTFFALVVCLACATSKEWMSQILPPSSAGEERGGGGVVSATPHPNLPPPKARLARGGPQGGKGFEFLRLKNSLLMLVFLIFLQLILGAALRHTGNRSLAISHIVTGFLVLVHAVLVMLKAFQDPEDKGKLVRPAMLLALLTLIQMSLGAGSFLYTVMLKETVSLTAGRIFFVTAHQSVGALLLAVSVFLVLRVWQMTTTNVRQSSLNSLPPLRAASGEPRLRRGKVRMGGVC